jgi:hypothetical protein
LSFIGKLSPLSRDIIQSKTLLVEPVLCLILYSEGYFEKSNVLVSSPSNLSQTVLPLFHAVPCILTRGELSEPATSPSKYTPDLNQNRMAY